MGSRPRRSSLSLNAENMTAGMTTKMMKRASKGLLVQSKTKAKTAQDQTATRQPRKRALSLTNGIVFNSALRAQLSVQ